MQIQKKNILNNAVGAAKIRLENNTYLRARNAADSADINVFRVNASNVIEFASIPQASGTPSANNDLATVLYVKNIAAGLRDPKDACRAASTANVNIASAPATLDGVTLASGDRILLKNQTTASENGIYVFNGTGNALTRSTDADEDAEVTQGLSTYVVSGTVNQRTGWLLSTVDPIVVGTTSLTFVQVPIPDPVIFGKETLTLNGTDITNQYKDLAVQIRASSLNLSFGGVIQREGVDYTLSTVLGVTRITFAGDLATGGASELVATDELDAQYAY